MLLIACNPGKKSIDKDYQSKNAKAKIYIAGEGLYDIGDDGYNGAHIPYIDNYPDSSVMLKGYNAMTTNGEISSLRIGECTSYYDNGRIRDSGEYQIGSYVQCCTGGACKQYYNYKVGTWKYYYPDGSRQATVIYETNKYPVETNCQGGDVAVFGKINLDRSQFWNAEGMMINPSNQTITELETVSYSQGRFVKESISLKDEELKVLFNN